MSEFAQLPSDRQLVDAARSGSSSAWGDLVARHRPAVLAVARELDRRSAQERTDDTFVRLRTELLRTDDGIDASTQEFGVRALRPRALALLTGGTFSSVPPHSGEPEVAELAVMGLAFGRMSETWQTVLWHRLVELEPTASVAPLMGRTAAEVVALETAAGRGLFEGFLAEELETPGAVESVCRPIVPLLGAYHRGTLPDAQRRLVDAHLGIAGAGVGDGACDACARRLRTPDDLAAIVPAAIVPGLTGLQVDRYRGAVGVAAAALGAAALAARRSARANRRARIAAGAVVLVALLAAAVLIRSPFGDLDGEIADLLDRSTTTTPGTTSPGTATTVPDGLPPDSPDRLPSRIELVFAGVAQGIVYVPGGPAVRLGPELSTPAPVYRNGTATIDLGLTNPADVVRPVRFTIRPSPGVSFDELAEGDATCVPLGDTGATCRLELAPRGSKTVSLRLALDATVSDRLLVVPSIRSRVLDLPVETVPGLALGVVGRGESVIIGAPFGSSRQLDLPAGVEIDEAVLTWRADAQVGAGSGDDPGDVPGDVPGDGPAEVGFTVPGRVTAVPLGVTPSDVTDLIRAAGAGSYTVDSSVGTGGSGSWTLVVVTRRSDSPRRLFVLVDPDRPPGAEPAVTVNVPIKSAAPPGPPRFPVRPLVVTLTGPPAAPGASVTVNGSNAEPRPSGDADPTDAYDLDIDSNDDALLIEVSPTARPPRIAAIGVAIDIVT
jgi:hypothetical protein